MIVQSVNWVYLYVIIFDGCNYKNWFLINKKIKKQIDYN